MVEYSHRVAIRVYISLRPGIVFYIHADLVWWSKLWKIECTWCHRKLLIASSNKIGCRNPSSRYISILTIIKKPSVCLSHIHRHDLVCRTELRTIYRRQLSDLNGILVGFHSFFLILRNERCLILIIWRSSRHVTLGIQFWKILIHQIIIFSRFYFSEVSLIR